MSNITVSNITVVVREQYLKSVEIQVIASDIYVAKYLNSIAENFALLTLHGVSAAESEWIGNALNNRSTILSTLT